MSTVFDSPRQTRARSWKLVAAGAMLVLLVFASIFAYVSYSKDAPTLAGATRGATTGTALTIGTISGAPLVPVETPIQLAGVTGLGSATVALTYDPEVVSITDVRKGNVPQSAVTWRHDEATGTLVLLLTTSLPGGTTGADALAFVTFHAREGAVGEVSPLTLAVRHAVSAQGEAMTLQASSGSFRNGVPGDVTGNGVVDTEDYARLADYLVGNAVTIVALNADLDGDGTVTVADAVKLHQMLDATQG